MWPCASCGTTNEPHMIFCSSCGASRYKPAARVARSAGPPEEPLAPSGPRFEGTTGGFVVRWVGVTLGAVFLGWIIQNVLYSVIFSRAYQLVGTFGIRMISIALSVFLYGGLIGAFQAGVLRRSLDGRGVQWLQATLAGCFVAGLAGLLLPQKSWSEQSLPNMLLWTSIQGVLGGSAMGIAQSLALQKSGLGEWMLRWTLVSVGANIIGNVAGTTLWKVLAPTLESGSLRVTWLFTVLGFAHAMVDALLTAVMTGLVLGGGLQRRFGSPAEESS